jgi:hypothetical protein
VNSAKKINENRGILFFLESKKQFPLTLGLIPSRGAGQLHSRRDVGGRHVAEANPRGSVLL